MLWGDAPARGPRSTSMNEPHANEPPPPLEEEEEEEDEDVEEDEAMADYSDG